jgi:Fe-S-cluster containining protein
MKIIKNIIKKFQSPKFIMDGSCKRCGTCCRMITFKIQDKFITSEEEFERLKIWQPRYKHFFISGKDEEGILLFTCKSLDDDNLCKNYMFRSLYCKSYPRIKSDFIAAGAETLEGCGFYYKSSVEFKSFLSKK